MQVSIQLPIAGTCSRNMLHEHAPPHSHHISCVQGYIHHLLLVVVRERLDHTTMSAAAGFTLTLRYDTPSTKKIGGASSPAL
jgi:hypothetical protein